MMKSFGSGTGLGLGFGVTAALAIALAGCGAEAEEVGVSQEAVTWSAWQQIAGGPVADQYGTAFISKQSSRFWSMVVPYDFSLKQATWTGAGNSFTPWYTPTAGPPSTLSSKPNSTSWLGGGGVDAAKNVVTAYMHYSGNMDVVIGWSPASLGGTYQQWDTMPGVSGFGSTQPALAYANGWLYLFAKKSFDNKVYFKRNNVSSGYSFANWSSSWTVIGTELLGGTVSAAASGSNTITIAGSRLDATGNPSPCVVNSITASTAAIANTGSWTSLPQCSPFSTPGLATTASGTGPARMVIWASDNTLKTTTGAGTSFSGFTSLPSGCTPVSDPAITEITSSGEMAIGTTCSGSSSVVSWIKRTP